MIGTREKRNFVLLYTYNSFLSLCISVIGTAAWSPPFRKRKKNKQHIIIIWRELLLSIVRQHFLKRRFKHKFRRLLDAHRQSKDQSKAMSVYIGRQTDSCLSRSRRSDKTRQRRILVNLELIERGATKSPPGQNEFLSTLFYIEASWVCMYEARAIQTSSSSSSAERRVSINMLAQKTPHLSRLKKLFIWYEALACVGAVRFTQLVRLLCNTLKRKP